MKKETTSMETIDVIESFDLSFNLGNAVKRILEAGRENDVVQDLKKAEWYLRREINRIETSRTNSNLETSGSEERKTGETSCGPMTESRIKTAISGRKHEDKTGGGPTVKSRIAAVLTGEP